jgi:signal transduction histidine kinase
MGMQIMRYRAQTIGGKLDVRSKPGGGVTVACTAPLAGRVS